MDRTIVSAGVLLACLAVSMPALAQESMPVVAPGYEWTSDRPDGHAPAGIKADYLLAKGEFYVGYRYSQQKFRGTVIGTDEVTSEDVLNTFDFDVATPSFNHTIHELDLRLGLSDRTTLEVSVPFFRNDMLKETDVAFFETSSEVLGDISIRGLFELLDMGAYRLSLTLGGTVPIGKLSKRGPTLTDPRGVLPFAMQGGSGTADLLAGGTFQVQNEVSSVGAQFNSVIRFYDNPFDYRLGNSYDFSVWGAYNVSDWASFSLRGLYENWSPVEGTELRTNGSEDPLANSFAQGGDRFVIPFGFSLYFREGAAAGHRLMFEFYYTVSEDLNGPQPSHDQTLIVSWQTLF